MVKHNKKKKEIKTNKQRNKLNTDYKFVCMEFSIPSVVVMWVGAVISKNICANHWIFLTHTIQRPPAYYPRISASPPHPINTLNFK